MKICGQFILQSTGLAKRLLHTGTWAGVIGVSGGWISPTPMKTAFNENLFAVPEEKLSEIDGFIKEM